ncbi:MAG: UDP-3-O-(3-hydroxymyristoyl)glucosamine N-acyltransferase [Porphyromonas sp.]|nr:UDP-3-O-(3-hydroxymyristoyl)glucosamine N-acyltransferase [Bacteroidales bacterium]MDY3101113.1 UDP-3-O-(3-hydroxymyristoyl)glucosamine N-acyltransferase [Porphyromonas sp.]
MKTPTLSANQVAELLDGAVEGNGEVLLSGFSSIEKGEKGDLSFVGNARYEDFLYTTGADAVLVRKDFEPKGEVHSTLIRVDDPYTALNRLVRMIKETSPSDTGVSPLAFVDDTAELAPDVFVGSFAYVGAGTKLASGVKVLPQAFVGKNCEIGTKTKIYQQAVISDNTEIGARCIIHSGAVIGADGFGFAPTEQGYEKIPQMGNVIIEDDVEIGANTCIDRAAIDATIVRKGAKVDNLVQLAHNTETGAHTVISAQTGIAGSTKLGSWDVLAGQVGVAGHLSIADRVTLAAKTGVLGNIKKEGGTYFGYPAYPHMTAMKSSAIFPHLPEMDKELYNLRQELEALKKELELLKKGTNQ